MINRTELLKTCCHLMSIIFSENMGNCIRQEEYYNILSNWGIEKENFEKYVSFDTTIDCDYKNYIQYTNDNLNKVVDFIIEQKINSRYGVQEYNIEQIDDMWKVTIFYKEIFYSNFLYND